VQNTFTHNNMNNKNYNDPVSNIITFKGFCDHLFSYNLSSTKKSVALFVLDYSLRICTLSNIFTVIWLKGRWCNICRHIVSIYLSFTVQTNGT